MLQNSRANSLVLLVEGLDDKYVIEALCKRVGLEPEPHVERKQGVDALLRSLDTEANAPGVLAMGVVVDADDSVESRWQAVADRLRRANIELPAAPQQSGTIISGEPRVGVWLMPNNQSQGELEDFVLEMIPTADPVWPRARSYIDGIPESHRKFAAGKILRARVHAWLAAREEPRQMGQAVRANDLDIDVAPCRSFVDWLRRLFGDQE